MIADSDSRVDRSTSVSSTRRMNVPCDPRASSQLNRAVRAFPTWRRPVGLGAKRTRMAVLWLMAGSHQRDRMDGDRFAATELAHALVGLALDADAIDRHPERLGNVGAHRVDVGAELRTLSDHGRVDV